MRFLALGFLASLLVTGVMLTADTSLSAIEPLPGPFGSGGTLLSPAPSVATPKAVTSKASPLVFTCADLRRAALNMSAHTSNMLNRTTSRTPEGGPYKRLEVVCKAAGGSFCDLEKVEDVRTELNPKHPDADLNGYVKLPVINIGNESAGLNAAASEIKAIATQGVCGTKALEQGLLTIVKYDADFEVMMDTMTFGQDGRISRWSRTTREGKTQNLTFKEDGTPVSL